MSGPALSISHSANRKLFALCCSRAIRVLLICYSHSFVYHFVQGNLILDSFLSQSPTSVQFFSQKRQLSNLIPLQTIVCAKNPPMLASNLNCTQVRRGQIFPIKLILDPSVALFQAMFSHKVGAQVVHLAVCLCQLINNIYSLLGSY
jgi:hypothetical protein